MHLPPASSDPQLMERDILQYSKGTIASIKLTMFWQSSLFTEHSREIKISSNILSHVESSSLGKTLPEMFPSPSWKIPYQVLLINLCAAKLQETDSSIHVTHLKKVLNPDRTRIPSSNLLVKISLKLKQINSDETVIPKCPELEY